MAAVDRSEAAANVKIAILVSMAQTSLSELSPSALILPDAPRKGRITPGSEDCRAIARRQVERLKATGVVELPRQIAGPHSWPPRDER